MFSISAKDITPSTTLLRIINGGSNTSKANSLLDVILGAEQRKELLEGSNFAWSKDIPVLRLGTGVGALIEDKYLKPLYNAMTGKEKFDQAMLDIGLNTLTEISEDLDD